MVGRILCHTGMLKVVLGVLGMVCGMVVGVWWSGGGVCGVLGLVVVGFLGVDLLCMGVVCWWGSRVVVVWWVSVVVVHHLLWVGLVLRLVVCVVVFWLFFWGMWLGMGGGGGGIVWVVEVELGGLGG